MGERFPARLARAIGYPDAVAADAARAALLVDGEEVVASDEGGRTILQANVAATPSDADALALREFFRSFTASWDWWRARAAELESPQPSIPEVMIRP